MWELFSEYSESSSLHGVKYVGQKKRHWVERAWWAFAFIISLVICGKLIFDTFTKWERFPVIVTFAEQSTRIWEIPFPAVTLCPQIKTKQTVFNYTNYFNLYQKDWTRSKELNASEFSRLKSSAQVCKTVPKSFLKIGSRNTSSDIYSNLRSIAPKVSDIMYHCDFNGHKTKDCSKFFKEIWTEEGLCYTFNFLNASDLYRTRNLAADYPVTKHNMSSKYWNVNSDYKKVKNVSEDQMFPYRVFGSSDGLTVSLKILEEDLDYLCGGSVDGFKSSDEARGDLFGKTNIYGHVGYVKIIRFQKVN
ncbi:hypothetical protein HA402_010926 [Bradysia odoriphaga]|nr:hypothetical protein HA402_010926 [Bradysia odoriphaga]